MADADLRLLMELVRQLQESMREFRAEVQAELHDMRAEIHDFRLETKMEIKGLESRMDKEFKAVRQTVAGYHASVLGQGVLVSELDERLTRVERHLGLSPASLT